MPPRYAYWTILVDDQPTAFRAGAKEDLLPTFNRLKEKQPSAKMMWFQNGKLWDSRLDAQEAMRARGEIGRRNDDRQSGFRDRGGKPSGGFRARERKPPAGFRDRPRQDDRPRRDDAPAREERDPSGKLGWTPKGEGGPSRSEKPAWKPTSDWKPKTEWKPKSDWKPTSNWKAKPDWKPKSAGPGRRSPASGGGPPRSEKLEWKPKTQDPRPKTPDPGPRTPEKRKWVPKEEYKRSIGIEAKKDKNWRPGGEHKDPRQKYKDAKKAKWSRFKQNIRAKAQGKKND